MHVVSITEDYNQDPGNAILTLTAPYPSSSTLQVAFKKPGSRDEYLGTYGWQSTPCWFGVKQQNAGQQEIFKIALSPDLALEMEPRPYEIQVKAAGQTYTAVFHWPEIRELESAPPTGQEAAPANFGYIQEAQEGLSNAAESEGAGLRSP